MFLYLNKLKMHNDTQLAILRNSVLPKMYNAKNTKRYVVAEYKINRQKSTAFLYTRNKDLNLK